MAITEPTHQEQELVKRLQSGDSDAFVEIYNNYHPALYHYVLRFVKVPAMAEDVLQDVFLKIWEIKDRIDPSLSFKAYLYRICRNSVFKLLKKISIDENLRLQIMQQLAQNISDADLKIQWQQYEVILKAAIDRLSPQRQKVFKLVREEGKSYEQVASELNISRNTVKEHMVLAMRTIKEHFQQYGNTPPDLILLLVFLSGVSGTTVPFQ